MEYIGLTDITRPSSLTKEQKKEFILHYLREHSTSGFIPTIIIVKDITEQHDIRPTEIPDLLEEMEQAGMVKVDLGMHGFNKKWAFLPPTQGMISPVSSQ